MTTPPEIEQAEHLIDIRRADEAIVALGPLIARAPDDPRPHLVTARAHLAAGRSAEAHASAKHALVLDPANALAAYLVGLALLGGEDLPGARSWIDQAITMEPLFAAAHAIRARIDLLDRRDGDALAGAEHAIELDPDDAFGHHTLGLVLHEQGRFRAAEAALRHALSIDPDDAAALSDLAETLAARGRPQDAAELLALAARADVRQESIQQDMLRYVRRGAGGLATWPIIIASLVMAIALATSNDPEITSTDRIVGGVVCSLIAVALVVARERRMRRFPAEVRRLLSRRSRTRAGFEIEVKGRRGFRPWWWLIVARIPLNTRAAVLMALWLFVALGALLDEQADDSETWSALLLLGVLPVFLAVRAVRAHVRAAQPHSFYPDP